MSWPGYWMNETGGELRPAVVRFLSGSELTPDELSLVVAYVRQWISAPMWAGVDELREKLYLCETTRQLHEWTHEANKAGIDPF